MTCPRCGRWGRRSAPLADSHFWVAMTWAPASASSRPPAAGRRQRFAGGSLIVPVRPGEPSAPSLGAALDSWDSRGKQVAAPSANCCHQADAVDARGVLERPGRFAGPGGVFLHLPGGVAGRRLHHIIDCCSVVVQGDRCHAELPGVRMGSSEIYHVVEQFDETAEALVVGVEQPEGEYRMPLFVVAIRDELNDALTGNIEWPIREKALPRHVPDEIIAAPAIPHTRTGRNLKPDQTDPRGRRSAPGHGRGAVDNPDALPWFARTRQGSRPREEKRADPHDRRDRPRARARRDSRSARLRLDQLLAHRRRDSSPSSRPRPPARRSPWPRRWRRLPPLARLDGPDGRHDRRPVRRPFPARARHRSPGDHGRLGRPGHRKPGGRDARVRGAGPRPAGGRPATHRAALGVQLRVQRLQGPAPYPHLPGGLSRRCCASPERSPTGSALGLPRLLRRGRGGAGGRAGPGASRVGSCDSTSAPPSERAVEDPLSPTRGYEWSWTATSGRPSPCDVRQAATSLHRRLRRGGRGRGQRDAISGAFIDDPRALGKPGCGGGRGAIAPRATTNPMITNITGPTCARPCLRPPAA